METTGQQNLCAVWLRLTGRGLELRNHNVASEKEQSLAQMASPDACGHSTPRTLLVTKAAPPASAGGAWDTEHKGGKQTVWGRVTRGGHKESNSFS